jgi:hypothetical protein
MTLPFLVPCWLVIGSSDLLLRDYVLKECDAS